jgi:hypothetical protein
MKKPSTLHRLRKTSRKAWLVAAAVAAFAVAGVAAAGDGPSSTSAVSASFVATTVNAKHIDTCTGADGAYVITHATYTGTSSGSANANLNGAIEIDLKSVYNTTTNLGWASGNVRFNPGTPGDKAHGKLTAVDVNGQLQGFLAGSAGPGTQLLGNVSAAFSSTGGFTTGSLGSGAATDTAIVTTGSCKPVKPVKPAPPTTPPTKPAKPPKPNKHGH